MAGAYVMVRNTYLSLDEIELVFLHAEVIAWRDNMRREEREKFDTMKAGRRAC